MEAVEFLRNYDRMCSTIDKCSECPAVNMKRCELCTYEQAKLVEIVEKWAKENPEEPDRERQEPEQERQKPEHPEEAADVTKPKQDEPCVKTIQDQPEGAIFRAIALNKARIEMLEYDVSVIRHNLEELHDKIYALSEKFYNTPTEEPSQTQEQKRTNKDVLLAAFPRMVMDGDVPVLCPRTMDRDIHIQHCAVRSCDQCRHEYWLSEVEK